MSLEGRHSQKGAALLVVAVMILLAALVTTGALRTAWLNELITGTEADYQRALANAQALLRDAELDVQGRGPAGGPCREGAEFERSCRRRGPAARAEGAVWYPQEGAADFEPVRRRLAARKPSCEQGICLPDGIASDFWRMPDQLDQMKAAAAHYGEFTGAPSARESNALLASKGWYWVEVLPFDASSPAPSGAASDFVPDADNPYIFRITAMAEGNKPSTRAVLQSLLVWKRVDS